MASTKDLRVENIFSVKGYVALVTGGGTGIGLMCTQGLAANGEDIPWENRSTSLTVLLNRC